MFHQNTGKKGTPDSVLYKSAQKKLRSPKPAWNVSKAVANFEWQSLLTTFKKQYHRAA